MTFASQEYYPAKLSSRYMEENLTASPDRQSKLREVTPTRPAFEERLKGALQFEQKAKSIKTLDKVVNSQNVWIVH